MTDTLHHRCVPHNQEASATQSRLLPPPPPLPEGGDAEMS
jgi:hypothetical protein